MGGLRSQAEGRRREYAVTKLHAVRGEGATAVNAIAQDRLVEGAPLTRTSLDFEHNEKTFAGEWSADVGAWRVNYEEWEFCHVLEGACELFPDGGAAHLGLGCLIFPARRRFRGRVSRRYCGGCMARRRDSAPGMFKAVVTDDSFNWADDRPPNVPWADTIIYEAHLRGLSILRDNLRANERGTFSALGAARPRSAAGARSIGASRRGGRSGR